MQMNHCCNFYNKHQNIIGSIAPYIYAIYIVYIYTHYIYISNQILNHELFKISAY